MFKRIFVVLLALCCAFCFISQPVAATGVEVVLTVAEIAMVVAAAFGLTFASNAGYESFGNSLHDSVISIPGSAGSQWWSRSLAGNIVLNGMDASVKAALWACAKKAADSLPQTESGSFTTDFTLSSYTLNPDGSVSSFDLRGQSYSFSHASNVPIFCLEFVSHDDTLSSDSLPYRAYVGAFFFSSETFSLTSSSAGYPSRDATFNEYYSFYYIPAVASSSYIAPVTIDDYRLRQNCTVFSSLSDVHSYAESLCVTSASVSSAGGATAAYPTYGYDGVNLPNIDLKKAGLIAEDGTSTVSDLIAQLQSGAITWEDYIGTVAPGQTATITLTDADGATATYTLVNTGVGTRVEAGTDVTEATEPIVVPAPGELTGTLADTDAKTFIDSIAKTIAKPFADVIEKVQAIPSAITEALSKFKPASAQSHFTIDLKEFFPFCIPFDLYDFFTCLNAAPVAPVIDWAIPLPGGEMYPMKLDLSVFDSVAQLLRRLELLLFCVGLAFKTRDLIKG